MSILDTLSNDALIDVLIFCYDDLQTVMNFALTCKIFYHTITERSERLWIYILENTFMNRKQSKPLFKKKTLSLLENGTRLSDKSKQLMSIIRTQVRYDRKHEILRGYYEVRDTIKYKYFRDLNIKDQHILKLLKKEQVESAIYSPENIIKEKYENNPISMLGFHSHQSSYTLQELIDALFRKENAYLELDVHNRVSSSYLYDFWKQQTGLDNVSKWRIVNFRYSANSFCRSVDDALLFIKLIYLEFPNLKDSADSSTETAYEQEKRLRGSFKNILRYFKETYHHFNDNIVEAVNIFANDLYGTGDVNGNNYCIIA